MPKKFHQPVTKNARLPHLCPGGTSGYSSKPLARLHSTIFIFKDGYNIEQSLTMEEGSMNGFFKVASLLFVSAAYCLLVNCSNKGEDSPENYKNSMKSFVEDISAWARAQKEGFVVVPQNGLELLTKSGLEGGTADSSYIEAINGVGCEELYYGYNSIDEQTPSSVRSSMLAFLEIAKKNGLKVLVTDYCTSIDNIDESYSKNNEKGFISFAASSRKLDRIPSYPSPPYNNHSDSVRLLDSANNFLYLINPDSTFTGKGDFINALIQVNYDVLIIDAFYNGSLLTSADVQTLKYQANRSRMVIAYMSIGEAEDYRYYWDSTWTENPPSWLAGENPDWQGNYKVRYWQSAWQSIIYGNDDSYLQKIVDAGFDGVYLDIVDAFEYFENKGE
jgi:cysteinyl-tRNA synthetase